jgi:hypothetical protein
MGYNARGDAVLRTLAALADVLPSAPPSGEALGVARAALDPLRGVGAPR